MPELLLNNVISLARHMEGAGLIATSVFDFTTREFSPEAPCHFCQTCPNHLRGSCDYKTAHRYGSFEAERWNGLYIYYCPAGLSFVSTLVHSGRRPAYAIVGGPLVMGSVEDVLEVCSGPLVDAILKLPQRTAAETTSIAKVQWAVAMHLSAEEPHSAGAQMHNQAELHNTLYDVTLEMRSGGDVPYPLEIEQRLQLMIVQGDKQSAQELINQLLGSLYFHSGRDFGLIKERAKELVVLFSRASMEGGADANQIFGHSRNTMAELEDCASLDELSFFLTSIFYRFVSYVFDFSHFEHRDILHKTINYMRDNYTDKITLEDTAAFVGLSKSYLSTIFKEELGSSYSDYLNKIRVEKSKQLLMNPALSIAHISDLVGYNDQSYFTKVFTKTTGVSPGHYRRKRGQLPT